MAKVVVNAATSLDGYIAGPRHQMDWVFDRGFLPDGPIEVVDEIIASTGAILSGRGSYDVGQAAAREETAEAFGGRWSGPEFVLTHRPPPEGPPRPGLTFLSGDITEAVSTALAAGGGRDLLVLGADVSQQCLAADLVDEIVLIVLPVLLGDGVRLFGRPGYRETRFTTTRVAPAGEAAVLQFRRATRSPN